MEKLLQKQWRNCFRNNGEIASETMEKLSELNPLQTLLNRLRVQGSVWRVT